MECMIIERKEDGEIMLHWNTIGDQDFIQTFVKSCLSDRPYIHDPIIYGLGRNILIKALSKKISAKNSKGSLEVFPNQFNLHYYKGDFLVLQWSWKLLTGDPAPPKGTEMSGWIVARKIRGLYRVLPLNKICDLVVSNEGFDLILEFKLRAMRKAIEDIREVVDALLIPQDGNPLTMVIRSPQPYHGVGMQIADRIKTIRDSVSNDVL